MQQTAAELRQGGVRAGIEKYHAAGARLPQQGAFGQLGAGIAGRAVCSVQQLRLRRQDPAQGSRGKGIVGAAQDHGVRAALGIGLQHSPEVILQGGAVGLSPLHELHQLRAGQADDPAAAFHPPGQGRKFLFPQGGLGGHDHHRPAGVSVGGRLQRRFDAQDGQGGPGGPQFPDGRGGGGVAGDDRGLEIVFVFQAGQVFQGQAPDLLCASGAVGGVG